MRCESGVQGERPILQIDVGRGGFTRFVPAADLELTSTQLEQYAGLYQSEEVVAPLHVLLRDGSLFLQLGFGVWPTQLRELKPDYPDIFSAPGISVRFVKERNRIKSMIVNTAQARYFDLKKN